MSAVAFYYYLIVLKQALVIPPAAGATRIRVPFFAGLTLALGAAALVVLGVLPTLVLRYFG